MAGALLRKARAYLASGVVRAWTPAAGRQQCLLADRADLEVARQFSSASSSSTFSNSREFLLANISRFISPAHACPQLVRNESRTFLLLPHSVRGLASQSAPRWQRQQMQEEDKRLSRQAEEDPFDSITDKIPERPVSVAEGASYSLIILAGLAVAAVAAYAVMKELIFEPKEYKIFGKALNRVQHDSQVLVRLGSPVTGYGQESRNRAARQRISNRTYVDEDGVERVEVMFYIRGPQGAGKVYSEMFKDKEDNDWKYTYLIVDITSPSATRLMLESYMPAMPAPIRA